MWNQNPHQDSELLASANSFTTSFLPSEFQFDALLDSMAYHRAARVPAVTVHSYRSRVNAFIALGPAIDNPVPGSVAPKLGETRLTAVETLHQNVLRLRYSVDMAL